MIVLLNIIERSSSSFNRFLICSFIYDTISSVKCLIRTLLLAQSLVSNGGVFYDNEFEIISREAVGA